MSVNVAAPAAPETPSSGEALILDDVSFALGPRLSGRLSLRVGCGEIVGLLGPPGAGKRSLLRVVAGEAKPLTGKIWTRQHEITHLSGPARQDAGVFVCLHDRRRLRANRSMLEIVATATSREPKVLLVDKPFHQLESILQRRALRGLLQTCRDAGVGVLFTDRDVRDPLSYVDRAYVMHEGKILIGGTPDFLLGRSNE